MSKIVTGTEYLTLPRAPETWLIDGLLPVGGAMLLFGDAKVGKSYAALQLATCLTTGVDWLGFRIPSPVPVVYIQLDTPRGLWANRIQSLVDEGYPADLVHQADKETLETHPFNILDPSHFALLTTELKSLTVTSDNGHPCNIEPGAVIIDTLRECHKGDENDSTEMQEVISYLEAAVRPAALILISHARKGAQDGSSSLMNDNRGSNYVIGRVDSICRFSKSSMTYTSRTLEETILKLERLDDGTWKLPKADEWELTAEQLMRENPDVPVRELARMMAAINNSRGVNAARMWFRRNKQGG